MLNLCCVDLILYLQEQVLQYIPSQHLCLFFSIKGHMSGTYLSCVTYVTYA